MVYYSCPKCNAIFYKNPILLVIQKEYMIVVKK